MNLRPGPLLLLAFVLGTLAPRIALATPGLDACTGVVEPDANGVVAIDQPGTWCLDRDHVAVLSSTYRRYIEILADDVTLDCRGHRLTFGGGYSEPRAITGNGHRRIVVRNCDVRGVWLGVSLAASSLAEGEFVVEDNTFRGNSRSIEVNGAHSVIRRNRIYDSSGEVVLVASNGGPMVIDNLIDGVSATPFVLWVIAYDGGEVRGNTIRNVPAGDMFNIHDTVRIGDSGLNPGRPVTVRDNVIVGSPYTRGIACESPTVHLVDNVITGVAEAYSGCTDAGDNDISP